MSNVIRIFNFEGVECWLDIERGRFVNLIEGRTQADYLSQFEPLIKPWLAWVPLVRGATRRRWVNYALRVICVVLGLRVRCVLTQTIFYANELVYDLLQEFFPSPVERRLLGLDGDLIVAHIHPDRLQTTVLTQQVLYEGDQSRGLSARFVGRGPRMEEHARAYEWDTWPDVLITLGEEIFV